MGELPAIFTQPGQLQQRFIEGLEQMLDRHAGLGVFILVVANASYDEAIQRRLGRALEARFDLLSRSMRDGLRAGRQLPDAPDDVDVFLKLMALGLQELPPTRFRDAGPFQLQFNLVRALRPPRMAGTRVERVFEPFDPDGFHFNRPFLMKERLWEGRLMGRDCRLLYNKFPFAHLHGLLLIEPEANTSQFLSEDDHLLVWELCERSANALPGLGFGYNSYGAYASVNHQHFQMFHHPADGYPVEAAHWKHNGGQAVYPVECRRLSDRLSAWREIAQLQETNQAFNLLYRPGRVYLLPRRFQGEYTHASWTSGFAWSELCGSLTTFNQKDFEQLDEQAIRAEMACLALR